MCSLWCDDGDTVCTCHKIAHVTSLLLLLLLLAALLLRRSFCFLTKINEEMTCGHLSTHQFKTNKRFNNCSNQRLCPNVAKLLMIIGL